MKACTFRRRWLGHDDRGGRPDALAGGGPGRPRGADRDGRRGRRAPDGTLLRGRHADAGRADRAASAAPSATASCSRSCASRASGTSASSRWPTPSPPTSRRPPIAEFPASRRSGEPASRGADDDGAARALGVEDDGRPVRRAHHAVPRPLGHAEVRLHRAQPHPRQRRAGRPSARAAGQDADARAGAAAPATSAPWPSCKDTHTSDTLGDQQADFTVPPIRFPEPVLAYAMAPKSRSDEDKIGPAMQRLCEEDPSIGYSRDPQTHDLLLAGQGQQHIEVTVAKLRRRFGVEVTLKPPHIPYRETITGQRRGARPPQEADGRPRPVRRLQDPDGAAAARRATSSSSTTSSAARFHGSSFPAVEKGIQDARVRGLPRRLPGRRLPRHAVRRLVPRRRLQRAVVQDGRPPGVPRRDVARAARRCSSR